MTKKIIKKESKKVIKSGKKSGHLADLASVALAQEALIEEKTKKSKKAKPEKVRSANYLKAAKKIDREKLYPLADAIKLLKSISLSQFNASVDAHLICRKTGLKGEIEFPHATGKKQNIRIADDQLIKDLDKGKIDFTLLVSTPQMMPKLMKYGKLLGPKGLMPNPKNGTITDKPEVMAKKLVAKTKFATEAKAPLIHLKIGKLEQVDKELAANFKALIEAVGRRNIQKAFLAPTMGPSIKVNFTPTS